MPVCNLRVICGECAGRVPLLMLLEPPVWFVLSVPDALWNPIHRVLSTDVGAVGVDW